LPAALPLDTLTAAREHLDVLARMGCRTWGDVAALPRGGLARRFGPALREALDVAWGQRPERHRWLLLPDVFEQKLELPALAESAPELMWSANRLLTALQIWLAARQRGVLALELQWTLDLRRFNGVDLPPHQSITVRTAQPTQDMAHLRRLMSERLALTKLAAPASWLRLRSLETSPWAGASMSFLPEDNRKGDKLHELVERLSARLGPQQVLVPVLQADHRPEAMQGWRPALQARAARALRGGAHGGEGVDPRNGSLYPSWLLREPLPLEIRGGHPWYRGRLRRLVGPQRLEAGWWSGPEGEGGHPAVRDYYIAESPEAGLIWVYRERLSAPFAAEEEPRWFLQGLYA
jgi:protein ImuB